MKLVRFVAREYCAADYELFAKYQYERAPLRPKECSFGDKCWVRFGPPCYTTKGSLGNCIGCGGRIKKEHTY
jgi:hypothetical protein